MELNSVSQPSRWDSVSPALPPGAESSEPEPEQEDSSLPPRGDFRKFGDGEGKPFLIFLPSTPIRSHSTNYPLAQRIWSALTEAEKRRRDPREPKATRATSGTHGTKAEARPIKDAHRWLQDRMWQGYVESGKATMPINGAPPRCSRHRMGLSGKLGCGCSASWARMSPHGAAAERPGNEIANLLSQWPPIGNEFDGREKS